jgi:predicted DNA-binding protein (MmcQ/YjbR family)
MAARDKSTDSALAELRAFGLTYPGAHTKSPWPGHLDLAVNDKTFAYLSVAGEPFKISCKLPRSSEDALSLPCAEPTPYGLGKSGWVTVHLPAGPVPVEMFKAWIDESYRAQAPKRLSASLPQFGAAAAEAPPPRSAQPRAAQSSAIRPRASKSSVAQRTAAPKKPAKKRAPAKRRAG